MSRSGENFFKSSAKDRTKENTVKALYRLISTGLQLDAAFQSRHLVVEMMKNYVHRLDLDVGGLSVIHVAGTKGKGSTCAFTEAILRQKGFRTGLFTSPHLVEVNERFRINGVPVEDSILIENFWAVWDGLLATKDQSGDFPIMPTFFHYLTLVGLRIFLAENVEVLVLEVGLGGRLDATNVIEKPKVCGITLLDYDHCAILGDTLDKIAAEKAGIIKPGVPVFTVEQAPEAMYVLEAHAKEADAALTVVHSSLLGDLPIGMKGSYQRQNAALAFALVRAWFDNFESRHPSIAEGGLTTSDLDVKEALEICHWPGRAQIMSLHDRRDITLYLDGAHTDASIVLCTQWFKSAVADTKQNGRTRRGRKRKILVFNCSHERNVGRLLNIIVSEVAFDKAVVAALGPTKPSRIRLPTAADVLNKIGMEAPDDDKSFLENSKTWEDTVGKVLGHLFNTTKSQRAHSTDSVDAEEKDGKETSESKDEEQDEQVLVFGSAQEAVDFIRSLPQYDDREGDDSWHVLVTGSLYLVGGVLGALHWKE